MKIWTCWKKDKLQSLNISEIIASCFKTTFDSQRVSVSKTLLKSAQQFSYPIVAFSDKLRLETSFFLVKFEILGLFVNKLTTDDKYSRHNRNNFRQSIQMQLSKKAKTFFQFFIAFLKFASNFESVEQKDTLQSLIISVVINSKKHVCLNV